MNQQALRSTVSQDQQRLWACPDPVEYGFSVATVSIHAVDNLLMLLMGLPALAKLKQMFRPDLEQAALDGGGATQPP
jgi:hypothetical protein